MMQSLGNDDAESRKQLHLSFWRFAPSTVEAFGRPLGGLWEASGRPLGGIGGLWEGSGRPLGGLREVVSRVSGRPLGAIGGL